MNIDSEKLMELIDEHEDRICRIDTRIIRDAIQSGELAPKIEVDVGDLEPMADGEWEPGMPVPDSGERAEK